MQVILLERVAKLGQMGDVVNVKNGFARNFLLPRGKALRATESNRGRFAEQKVHLETRNLELKKEAEAVQVKLDGQRFVVIRQAGENGQLYGSVAPRDVSDAATTAGFSVDRRQVVLDRPIKMLGLHEVKVLLHPEVVSKVVVNVARSADEAERQARGEDVLNVKEEGPVFENIGAAMFEEGDREERAPETGAAEGAKDGDKA